MKKVLFVATVDSHIELFHLPFLKMFKEWGYEVHVATESSKKIEYCDKKIQLPIKRSPLKLMSNYKAVRKLRRVLKTEGYNVIHCHTPVGGVVARLASRKLGSGRPKVMYTAHGLHFYKGAPLHYWVLFYPVEWYLSKYTDTLITINDEDYRLAKKKFGKRCHDIRYVPGVGVDEGSLSHIVSAEEKKQIRGRLGIGVDDKIIIFPAELSKNKNQIWLINTLKPLLKKSPKIHVLLPGRDSLNGACQKLIKKLGLEQQIHILGFRRDIPELLQISDVAVSSSKREGLPVNLMEAAILRVPIVATDCRGNRDVCKACGGVICQQKDSKKFVGSVEKLLLKKEKKSKQEFEFTAKNVWPLMEKIYEKYN